MKSLPPTIKSSSPLKTVEGLHSEIPPTSSAHISSSSKLNPTDASQQSTKDSTTHLGKRKRDVYVMIPGPPMSTTLSSMSHVKSSASGRTSSSVRLSSSSKTKNPPKRASPLSSKAFNINAASGPPKKKSKQANSSAPENNAEEPKTETFYCHQCSRKFTRSDGLNCSAPSHALKKTKYCKPCLKNRYEMDDEVVGKCNTTHLYYEWTCPKCLDICNCSRCRKKNSIEKTKGSLQSLKKIRSVKFLKKKPGVSTPSEKQIKCNKSSPKKPIKEKVAEPKWVSVPIALGLSEIEDRFYLREFILRFSTIMKIADSRLEELDEFHRLTRTSCKVLTQNLLDLIAADADQEKKKLLKDAAKRIGVAGIRPSVIWANLCEIREQLPEDFFVVPLPDPAPAPSDTEESDDESGPSQHPRTGTRSSSRLVAQGSASSSHVEEVVSDVNISNDVTHSIQLLPVLLALCENAIQGPSIRAELEEGNLDVREVNKEYFSGVRDEMARWSEEQAAISAKYRDTDNNKETEKENDKATKTKPGKGKIKGAANKKEYQEACAKHDANLRALTYAHELGLQSSALRFKPLGRDSQGRVYYAASARRSADRRRKVKVPSDEERSELRKFGWFLAVWGNGGTKATLKKVSVKQGCQPCWWGFSEPSEIRQLAKWLASSEGLDVKDSEVKTKKTNTKGDNKQGPPTCTELKALVKGIADYADLLEWRISGGAT